MSATDNPGQQNLSDQVVEGKLVIACVYGHFI
jgi:hypothetical protein